MILKCLTFNVNSVNYQNSPYIELKVMADNAVVKQNFEIVYTISY